MNKPTKLRKLILGFLSGLLSGPLGLVAAYLVGVVLTGFKTREVLPTLLAAATVLPLMLLFVLAIPTLVISILSGVVFAFARQSILVSGAVGLILAEIILTILLPLLMPGEFTSIISTPLLSGTYGLLLGVIAGAFFQLFIKWNTPH